jgi:hypothetical protein
MKFESPKNQSRRSILTYKESVDGGSPPPKVEDLLKNEILQRKAKNEAN